MELLKDTIGKIKRCLRAIADDLPNTFEGSWEGTSQNKKSDDERRTDHNLPNDFSFTFTLRLTSDNRYTGQGTLYYEQNGKQESSAIEINIHHISDGNGIIMFDYKPPLAQGFYGTGMCSCTSGNKYSGETIGRLVGVDNKGFVSADIQLEKIEE